MLDAELLKATAWQAIRQQTESLKELALRILQHPELGYAETQASTWLCDELARHGFEILRPWPGLPTAFLAERSGAQSASPRMAFLAGYDALPDVGHSCGHNLIGGGYSPHHDGLQHTHQSHTQMFMIKTHPSGIPWHSAEVAEASEQAIALQGMVLGACALAGVAVDLLSDPALLQQARKDFEHVRCRVGAA